MSEQGIENILFVNLRAAGSKDNKTGTVYGGIYHPAHSKNGKINPARWEGNFFLNRRGWKDENGVQHEGKGEVVRLIVWNSKTCKPGKGRADNFAKIMSVGKSLTVRCEINTFTKRVFIGGQPVINPETHQPVEYPAITFRVVGDIVYGDDSEATLKKEIAAFTGNPNFGSRPAQWNVLGSGDHTAWKDVVLPTRMASVYNGKAASYGYARTMVAEGAIVITPENMAAQNAGAANAGDAPSDAAAALTGQQADEEFPC